MSLFPPVYETVDNAHGRIEIRRIRCSSELQGYIDFPFHKQVALIERIVERNGRTSRELAYIITSLDKYRVCPERLLKLNRGHWIIENGSHWVRDVTFDEDRSQIRTGSGPRVMATLRNLAIGVLRLAEHKNIARGLRFFAARPELMIEMLGI